MICTCERRLTCTRATDRSGSFGCTDRSGSCPACGGVARPAVVWFGEALDRRDVEAARAVAACDVFVTIGTSAVVYPAAGFLHDAREHGAFTAEINLEET